MPRLIARAGRILLRLALVLPSYVLFGVALLVPKSRRLWLFGAWMGRKYSDNPKYIFQRVMAEYPGVRPLWIAKDRHLARRMREEGLPVAYVYEPRGLLAQLRAGLVVFTHSVPSEFVAPLISPSVRRIQAWHGMPIKKIGFDESAALRSPLLRLLRSLAFREHMHRYDLVIASGPADAEKYREAFDVDPSDVRMTGYPRNDALTQPAPQFPKNGGRWRAIYMPTFRGGAGSEFQLFRATQFDFAAADAALERVGWHLDVKLHPVQHFSPGDLSALQAARCMRALSDTTDVYAELGRYDALITDFSSVYLDFLITGKPVILAPFEIEAYMAEDRGLYYDYADVCPSPPVHSWAEVFDRLADISAGGGTPTAQYRDLQRKYHAHRDAGASRRVVAELLALMRL